MRRRRWAAAAVGAASLLGATALVEVSRGESAGASLPPAYEVQPLPRGLDSLTSLAEATARAERCFGACRMVLYLWTPRMPLSRAGIPRVARAAGRLGAGLTLVAYDELADFAGAVPPDDGRGPASPAEAMLAGGALAHAPALLVVRDGRPLGPAILGYKTAAAYEASIARRLAAFHSGNADGLPSAIGSAPARVAGIVPREASIAEPLWLADYDVVGVPGAYFRWVPGRNAVAYESGQRVYILDLGDGESRLAPGFIDFVPTPDGRYFVTPGEVEGGLTFYDADQVFAAVQRGRPGEVEPIFTDLLMRDQYPSVGILDQDSTRTLYRVMTSWFEGVVYRDYDVRVDPRSLAASVRPVGEPVRPCADVALSTPIMSQDGREVAGRDEATGTTKIFRILEGGRCETRTDFGVATSKVAWHSSGRKLAFSVPRRRRGGGDGEQGIFVLDRDAQDLERLSGSGEASRLAFPDFVGDDSVVFLVPGGSAQRASIFRVVDLAP